MSHEGYDAHAGHSGKAAGGLMIASHHSTEQHRGA